MFDISEKRTMAVATRKEGEISFQNTLPIGYHVPRQYKDVATAADCAIWCWEEHTCVYFEFEPKTRINQDGVCIITNRFD